MKRLVSSENPESSKKQKLVQELPLIEFIIARDIVHYIFSFINSDYNQILRLVSKGWSAHFPSTSSFYGLTSRVSAYGHLNLLKWLRQNDCPWNKWTCVFAAFGGHLDCLKWARENGCPWDEDTCARSDLEGH